MELVKKMETVIETELGMSPDSWRVEGHGAPMCVWFYELDGVVDMAKLREIAVEVRELLVSTVWEPEKLKIENPDREEWETAVLGKSEETAELVNIGGVVYGANPGKWCVLAGYSDSVYFVETEDSPLKVPEVAKTAFDVMACDDAEYPLPAFDRYDWLTSEGLCIKGKLEALGVSVRIGVTNTEAADVLCFC